MQHRARPLAETNLTRLDDLAAAVYESHATEPVAWAGLSEGERSRWVSITGYILDIALPPAEHDQGPAMERIRLDARGARQIAARQFARFIEG